ncbi:hypothetical protein Acr_00g0015500 [Actinidia rufa]|uniref:Uncharacterized protein n=1 Tax=Actinidia rufa TaxID=165716 RepID=A0A7J0DAL1_9ERIC|nr:hypothetical protein Acr_00g0015500 [Actinidia rufa]
MTAVIGMGKEIWWRRPFLWVFWVGVGQWRARYQEKGKCRGGERWVMICRGAGGEVVGKNRGFREEMEGVECGLHLEAPGFFLEVPPDRVTAMGVVGVGGRPKPLTNVGLTWRVPELRNAIKSSIASSLRSLLSPHFPAWHLTSCDRTFRNHKKIGVPVKFLLKLSEWETRSSCRYHGNPGGDISGDGSWEEMACEEAELGPDKFAEKMQMQHKLQEQQLEMLKHLCKFHLDDQSAILEKLRQQMEASNFDSEASVFSADQIQDMVRRRVTPVFRPR